MTSGGAHDCSIAAQIKAITGHSLVEVGADTVDALTAAGASDADAGPAPDAGPQAVEGAEAVPPAPEPVTPEPAAAEPAEAPATE